MVHSNYVDESQVLAKKWALALLIEFDFLDTVRGSYRSGVVTDYLLGADTEDLKKSEQEELLRQAYQESKVWVVEPNSPLEQGIKQLQTILKLSDAEAALFKFAVTMKSNKALSELCNGISDFSARKFYHVFSQLLGYAENDIRSAMKSTSKLYSCGLLDQPSSYGNRDMDDYFSIDNDYIVEAVLDGQVTVEHLLEKSVRVVHGNKLEEKDYSHIEESLNILKLFLSNKLAENSKGGNVLLYGPPGTGKTELSRLLASALNTPLYEVRVSEQDGDVLGGQERMMQYLFAQALLEKSTGMMVFDEFEDSFDTGTLLSRTKPNKGWINNVLESNNLPCIWICNDLDNLHDAYLRRFDLVVEVPFPDKSIKTRLLNEMANFTVEESVLKELSGIENLSPAIIESSCKVINSIAASLPDPSAALKKIIHSALGVQSEKSETKAPKAKNFCTQYIQASQDLSRIPEALKDNKLGARICLYGPPGTGKTAYAHWLSEQVSKPIISKKSSDLIGSYVGETERNIASAFKAAKDTNSVLLLDEVDSFIYERSGAQRSWEVSCVNEMLTQMEEFEGIFIATTNRPDNLDQASLRRFDLKVDFDFLDQKQVRMLVADYCEKLELDASALEAKNLDEFEYLTPGDFAAVKRRARFAPIDDLDALLQALKGEMSLKEQAKKRRIGF